MNKYQPVIGLEVHIELSTKSKMFCNCSADYFGKEPNTHTCPICLGLPGALPKANKKAIEYAQLLGLALNCQVQSSTKFDRKNYFYPDLAKGFQISQYDLPFSINGHLIVESQESNKKIGITRVHLEEDTGKLIHAQVNGKRVTLIDFNRSGVPLLEVVSEPDMNSAQEAKNYAQKLQQIVRYLTISDADMEKGSMRIEPNVSLRKVGKKTLPAYKVELKNINSFKFAEKAINYEIERQAELLAKGEVPAQETRGWSEDQNKTVSQRSKEAAHDYRYFPEPDLPPFSFDQKYIYQLKTKLPELPDEKQRRFIKKYRLSGYDTGILTREPSVADYFEESVITAGKTNISAKTIANVIINQKPDINSILPVQLVQNIQASRSATIIDESEVAKIIEKVLSENPKAVLDYKKGKGNALMFLVGQVIRLTTGKSDAQRIMILLKEKLDG